MPRVPIDQFDAYVKQCLTAVRKGAGDFAQAAGQGVRLGPVQFTCEVVFPGEEVLESKQETTENAGASRTTTTEQPFTQYTETVRTGSVTQHTDEVTTTNTEKPISGEGEKTRTTKSGSYVQSGTNGTSQGGGSLEVQSYQYDEA